MLRKCSHGAAIVRYLSAAFLHPPIIINLIIDVHCHVFLFTTVLMQVGGQMEHLLTSGASLTSRCGDAV